jgi:tetratricopeptide (TPR) repeat protein
VVEAVQDRELEPADLLPQLSAYARALRFEARWMLAADAFATLLANAEGGEEELVITAAYHRGYCLRMAGELDAAAASYDEGRLLAASCGNAAGMLEADVSHAALALHRGNLPAAERLLDGVIERADPVRCAAVLGRALHHRAGLAARRGHPEQAIVFGYRAFPLIPLQSDRDRVLGDIATALGEAGHHEAAWDAQLVLAATAQEQETRWVATVNLIELAAWRGNERLFERFRVELADATLPVWLSGHYHLFVGEGFHRFGRRAEAKRSLQRAVTVAAGAELNEIRMRAEDSLAELDRAPAAGTVRPAQPDAEVGEVIAAVRTIRELAGISAE